MTRKRTCLSMKSEIHISSSRIALGSLDMSQSLGNERSNSWRTSQADFTGNSAVSVPVDSRLSARSATWCQ
jgi:hypothetical protein